MSSTPGKAAISLSTGLEDAERVTVAFLMAVGAAEQGRPTMMFLTKEAVRLAVPGIAVGTACDGCPPLPELMDRYERAGGRYLVCPICVNSKKIDSGNTADTTYWPASTISEILRSTTRLQSRYASSRESPYSAVRWSIIARVASCAAASRAARPCCTPPRFRIAS